MYVYFTNLFDMILFSKDTDMYIPVNFNQFLLIA